ncbi:MAG: glutamate--cysteine ligase [Proteobacteria bacterium]|nr:glutamate--cysteine ligase [Pseudomonadota bacterium]
MANNGTSPADLIASHEQLVEHLSAGNKPAEDWRIGTEHEKFGFRLADRKPLTYDGENGIFALFQGLCDRYGWQPVLENGRPIALTYEGQSVSLEPGGQLELSGAPLETLHQTCDEVHSHLAQVKTLSEELEIGFLGIGFTPDWTREDMPVMPKARYGIMRAYMPKRGNLGLDMMFRTCTVQVNLDFASEADMVKKFRVALALQPIATALFANSPFTEGKPNGFLSRRSETWNDTDPDRTGVLPFVFEDGMGFERYADHALDVPMYFVYRDGKYIDASGQSFRDFLKGKLPALPGELPTMRDWEDHLTTLFPEVRLKTFLEMRGADGGPWRRLCALPALWVGLLYDTTALDAAWDIVKNWSSTDHVSLRKDVPRLAFAARVGDRSVGEIAREMVSISEQGLRNRARQDRYGEDESHFLDVLKMILETGRTPAEDLLELYHGEWGGRVDPIYERFAF